MTKFCKDCKWHKPYVEGHTGGLDKCGAPSLQKPPEIDLISGQAKNTSPYCDFTRNKNDACGPDAILFESKELAPTPGEQFLDILNKEAVRSLENA